MTSKKDPKSKLTNTKTEGVALEQALKEEGEGCTPHTINKTPAK